MSQISEISFSVDKLTKALPDPTLFTNWKDLSINQWLSKIQGKFKINWDYYLSARGKLIYVKTKIEGKT